MQGDTTIQKPDPFEFNLLSNPSSEQSLKVPANPTQDKNVQQKVTNVPAEGKQDDKSKKALKNNLFGN